MRTIPLNRGYVALVDDEDYQTLSRQRWCVDIRRRTAYARPTDGSNAYMHRALLPDVRRIDHVDGNGLNNQKHNLRFASASGNGANQSKRLSVAGVLVSSRFKGVDWDASRDKWRAQIMVDYRNHFLGRFDQEEDAARAYDKASVELFGEFAQTNGL